MSRLIRASSAGLSAKVRGRLRALRNMPRCTKACQIDRELMTMRTNLSRRVHTGSAGE